MSQTKTSKLFIRLMAVWAVFLVSVLLSLKTTASGNVVSAISDDFQLFSSAVDLERSYFSVQKITANDPHNGGQFGVSVAISGDTAVVGAYLSAWPTSQSQRGAAYVFVLNGTQWVQQQKLTAADGQVGDLFGHSVSISGDTIVVGADGDNGGSFLDHGSAYVFTRTGTTWTQQQKLTANDMAGEDRFGMSVGIDAETIIVGADGDDTVLNADQGSAYVFIRNGTIWTQQAKLVALDGAFDDRFGWSVAIAGETAVLGAPFDDVDSAENRGSAYVFVRDGTAWNQQTQLIAPEGMAGDEFGFSSSISNHSILVGSFATIGSQAVQGAAYVFVRQGSFWEFEARLLARDAAPGDFFGKSVSIRDDIALVGAYGDDLGPNLYQGSAYTFKRNGNSWAQWTKSYAYDGSDGDRFGYSVATNGDTSMVGAFNDNLGGGFLQGSAYMFSVGPNRSPFDYDADGRTDFSVFRPSEGGWYLQKSTEGFLGFQWGVSSDNITPADFDGDGRTDIAVYRPSDNRWYIVNSSNGTYSTYVFGLAEDVPVPADYDGDGSADLCVFRPSDGVCIFSLLPAVS